MESDPTEPTTERQPGGNYRMPPGMKRNAAQRAADLAFIERMVIRSKTSREIARLLSAERPYTLSHVQVYKDIRKLEEMWMTQATRDIALEKQRMLQKLETLECEMWDAWDRSKTDETQRTVARTGPASAVEGDGSGEKAATKKVEGVRKVSRDGDAAFAKQILEIQDRKAKLLGLDAPTRNELSGPGGGPIPVANVPLTDDDQEAILQRHFNRTNRTSNGAASPTPEAPDPA
jgi:hypothetical protein